MAWLAERFSHQEHPAEKWRQFIHALHTPPPEAFTRDRLRVTQQYRQLRAAEPPRSKKR